MNIKQISKAIGSFIKDVVINQWGRGFVIYKCIIDKGKDGDLPNCDVDIICYILNLSI